MQKIVLTISLLVSNRIDTIRKCMESIRPILEQLPSELIAIDTVGEKTDGSIAVVREYTNKIYPFTWCNDFSAARNEGIKRAKGDWFMFLDDDEWFEDVSEIITFFKSGEYKKYNCATYKIRNYHQSQTKKNEYSVASLYRMIKREPDTRFCGVVHEQLSPLYMPCKELSSFVHHYGYMFDSLEEKEQHSERNLSLLRPAFEKNPYDMQIRVQMVQECMFLKKLEDEALRICEDTMKLKKQFWEMPGFQWILTAYVRIARKNDDWEIVLKRAAYVREHFSISSFTNLALSVMELAVCRRLHCYELVKESLHTLDKSVDFLLNNPKKRLMQSIMDFDVFLEPSVLAEAYADGIFSLYALNDLSDSMEAAEAGYQYAGKALSKIELQTESAWKLYNAQWIMLSTLRYFVVKKDLLGARNQLTWLEEKYKMNPLTYLCITGMLANLAAEEGVYRDALFYAKVYLDCWDWKEQQKEEKIEAMLRMDMMQFCTKEYYGRVLRAGAAAARQMGQQEEVERLLERMPDAINHRGEEKMTPKFIKSNIKLTVGMLVSNHKEYIRKAMEALKPLLDAVPSELIVIDTMGENGDGSIDIVREYTDKIYPFTWCNDFSAARNECMKRAKGEWFLYQDDDEWFDDVQEFIDFFQNGECEKYHAGFYQTRDYLTEGGYSEGVAGRMVRRTATTRFVGRVHETFNEVYGPNKEFSCFTHHYGYVYASKEDTLKKQKRNLDLINLEIAEGGLTPRWAAQYVLELTGEEDTREEAYQKAMEFIPQLYKMGEIQDSCSQWILTASVRHFSSKETYQQLLEQAEYILKNYPLSQTAELVLASTVVVTAAEVEDFDTVLQYAELYLKNYDWRQKHESKAMIQVQLDFPGFVKESFHHQILHFAAKAANALEDFDRANEYWKRMPWKQEDFNGKYYEKDLGITIRGMRAAKDAQYDAKVESLLPLVQILTEAAEQVKQEFLAGNAATAKQYLVGMQEAAISLGTSLDSLIGEGSTTVRLLEQYCELLWNCNNTERAEDGLALAEVLYEATNLIQDSFWKEARRKQLILLLPKRGSEWPLFEPYWQEAKQNGDKVVVIPVPCYEKHYNGMRGEVIYGEEKYPENVEITDYKLYNYNDKLVDLMVVMEDYNDQQKFYSVHPFFYIDNLGQYTKKMEIVSEWDGGIGALERQIEELKQMVEDAKKSR